MSDLSICLDSGGNRVDRQQVIDVQTPSATRSWTPVAHYRLLDLVESTLDGCGLRVVDQAHALWGNDSARYFGLLEVITEQEGKEDYGLVVGLRNSHDKTFPAGIAIGTRVFVCDNLAFCSDVVLKRKHTRFIDRDLPLVVSSAVGQLTLKLDRLDQRIERYKQVEIDDRSAHDIIVRALDCRVLQVTRIPDVLRQWREPNHPEFAQERNVWRLFNAFTETAKGTTIATLPKRTRALHGLMDSVVGLTFETSA